MGYATSKLSAVCAEIVYVVSEMPLQTFKPWWEVRYFTPGVYKRSSGVMQ